MNLESSLLPSCGKCTRDCSNRIRPSNFADLDYAAIAFWSNSVRVQTAWSFERIQPRVERDVAIKVFNEQVANDADFAQRFEVEAQAAAALEHASIVPIYDYWREPGRAYIVSRFLARWDLARVLVSSRLIWQKRRFGSLRR